MAVHGLSRSLVKTQFGEVVKDEGHETNTKGGKGDKSMGATSRPALCSSATRLWAMCAQRALVGQI